MFVQTWPSHGIHDTRTALIPVHPDIQKPHTSQIDFTLNYFTEALFLTPYSHHPTQTQPHSPHTFPISRSFWKHSHKAFIPIYCYFLIFNRLRQPPQSTSTATNHHIDQSPHRPLTTPTSHHIHQPPHPPLPPSLILTYPPTSNVHLYLHPNALLLPRLQTASTALPRHHHREQQRQQQQQQQQLPHHPNPLHSLPPLPLPLPLLQQLRLRPRFRPSPLHPPARHLAALRAVAQLSHAPAHRYR